MKIPTIYQTRAVVSTMISMRLEELGYKEDDLSNKVHIEDDVLAWLVEKHDAIDDNIKRLEK